MKGRPVLLFIMLIGGFRPWSPGLCGPPGLFPDAEKGGVPRPWALWGEFYDETTKSRRNQDNPISFSHVRIGFRKPFTRALSLETYLLLRYGKDLHRDFWNNRFEWGPAWRLRFSQKIFLAYYMEFIQGQYLNLPGDGSQTVQRKYSDFRTGLIFWYGWDKYRDPVSRFSLPADFWGDAYSDISYYRKENKNTIGYAHIKSGIHALRFWKTTVDAYAVVYANADTKKYFWNNRIEAGPGSWIRPWEDLDLKFYVEWLNGTFSSIKDATPNPYSRKYYDRRIGILFWIGW